MNVAIFYMDGFEKKVRRYALDKSEARRLVIQLNHHTGIHHWWVHLSTGATNVSI